MPVRSSLGKFKGWNLALQAFFVLSFLFIAIFISVSDPIEVFRLFTRLTARISLVLFSFAFIASSAFYLWPKLLFFRWLVQNRRYIGVSFAISHLFHLAGIIGVGFFDTEVFMATTHWTTFVFGGLVYVLIIFMLVTSFEKPALWVSVKNWKLGHQVGSYGIWFIFMVSYFGRLVEARWVYAVPALLILSTVVIRALAFYKRQKLR